MIVEITTHPFTIDLSDFTGEPIPVERFCTVDDTANDILEARNVIPAGSKVMEGACKVIAITTAANSFLYQIIQPLSKKQSKITKKMQNFHIEMNPHFKLERLSKIKTIVILNVSATISTTSSEELLLYASLIKFQVLTNESQETVKYTIKSTFFSLMCFKIFSHFF